MRRARPERATRRLAAATAGLALLVALAGAPVARAVVSVTPPSGGEIAVSILQVADEDHGVVVEPFKDGSRDGWRVRQDQFGRPAINDFPDECDRNALFNDVNARRSVSDAVDPWMLAQQRAPAQALPDLLPRHAGPHELRSGNHAVSGSRDPAEHLLHRPALVLHCNT